MKTKKLKIKSEKQLIKEIKLLLGIFLLLAIQVSATSYESINMKFNLSIIKTENYTFISSEFGNYTNNQSTFVDTIYFNGNKMVQSNATYCSVNVASPIIQNNITCPSIPAINNPITVNVPDTSERCLNASLFSTETIMKGMQDKDDSRLKDAIALNYFMGVLLIVTIIAFCVLLFHDRTHHIKKEEKKDDRRIPEVGTTPSGDKPKSTAFDKYA